MKQLLLQLLTMIVQLGRIPKDNTDATEKQKKKIDLKRDEITVFHGDHEVADPEIVSIMDDLIEVAASSEPDEEYAEVPDDIDEDAAEGDGTGGDDVEGESDEAKAQSEAAAAEDAGDADADADADAGLEDASGGAAEDTQEEDTEAAAPVIKKKPVTQPTIKKIIKKK